MIAFSACYKAEFNTVDPNYGKIEVEVEVSLPTDSSGETITDPVTMLINGVEYTVGSDGSVDVGLLEEGTHTYYTYSVPTTDTTDPDDPDGSTGESSSTITYDTTTGLLIASIATIDDNGNIATSPDPIYFAANTIDVSDGSATTTDNAMESLIGDLDFKLLLTGDATERLTGVTAELNGVAQHWDCINNTFYGSSASVLPTLTVVSSTVTKSSSDEEYYLEGSVSLLGVVTSESQIFTLEFEYEDSYPATHTLKSDITSELATFNDNKSTKMTLTNTVETPTEKSPSGTIGDWSITIYDVEAK